MRTLCVAMVAALSFAQARAAEPAAPATQVVTATGEADIHNGEVAAAKEKARQVALREAVNQVVGATITSVSETADFALVRDVVFSQTAGYVKKWEPVGEKVDEEGGLVSVTLKVEVAKGAIDKDAAAIATLLGMKKQKRVYVMVEDVSTDTVGQKAAQAVATTRHGMFDGMLREQLRKDGFTTLDPNLVDGKLKSKAAIQALSTPQEAREIANAVGADVIIYGNATGVNDEGEVAGVKMSAVMVRTSLTAVAPDSGEVIADYNESVQATSYTFAQASTQAMKKASEAASKEIRARLYESWRKSLMGEGRVALTLTGVRDYGMLQSFKSLLTSQVRGVKDVASVRMEKGSASMELSLSGSTEDLAGSLSGKRFKGQTVQVTKVTPNTIEVALGGK